MVRHTRRQHRAKSAHSIPEVRQSFERIERFVDEKLQSQMSKTKLITALQKEWTRVFHKSLKKESADSYITHRMSAAPSRRKTRRSHGGASALAGAPLMYTTRPGLDLAPGQIPTAAGHLPLSSGAPSNFGSYVNYVSKGFGVGIPEQAGTVTNQWPIPYKDTGCNAVIKGGNRRSQKRKARRGGGAVGALLSQAFIRPISSSQPPGVLQDMQDMWHGKTVGASSDQVQRQVSYMTGPVFPKPVRF
jgi:hypothetical protein